ncbi:DUF3560 domain-containing protein [Streptomyces sp. NPDC001781]
MTDNPSPERRRADRLQQRADRLTVEAEQQRERADGMFGRFAGGQPLLVGHHSYRSARRTKDRAHAADDRALSAYTEAKRAQESAKHARAKADAKDAITDITATRSRSWERGDFRVGDIVTVRTFDTHQDTYRVKRVNAKTLTLDGGGGGWDDPKRPYDRVLSRTRDGVTVTDPAAGEATA